MMSEALSFVNYKTQKSAELLSSSLMIKLF